MPTPRTYAGLFVVAFATLMWLKWGGGNSAGGSKVQAGERVGEGLAPSRA